jgi:hypothetical protein
LSFSVNAQSVLSTYETRNFTSNLLQATNLFCSANASTSGTSYRVNIISPTANPLQINKLYKFTDEESNIIYLYVVSKNAIADTDRDSYSISSFVLQSPSCLTPKGYNTRDLGSNYSTASNLVCSGAASTSGTSSLINVLSTSASPLEVNKLYKFTDDNSNIKYLYVLNILSEPVSDRDSFFESSFIVENPTCTYGYNTRNLGNNLTTATPPVCTGTAATSGTSFLINISSSISTNPLEPAKLYKFTDEANNISYLYVINKLSSIATDRDIYSQNSFMIQFPFCDFDNDGIEDNVDNCKLTSNANQLDSDSDGKGNVCDNCPSNPNSSQSDIDSDGIGDVCDNDIDGDDVLNGSDNCPTIAGPTSNNGCPFPADLTIYKYKVSIFSNCFDCSSNLDNLGNKRHILNRDQSGIISIQQIIIDNIGSTSSTSTDLKFYLSVDATYSLDDYYFSNYNISLPQINPNDYLQRSKGIFAVDVPSNKVSGNYNILIIIDKDNSVNEGTIGGENNNLISIPISYTNSNSNNRNSLTKESIEFLNTNKSDESFNDDKEFYAFEIYNFSGTLINSSKVNSIEQENDIISKLPSGLYIIKTPSKTKKILK